MDHPLGSVDFSLSLPDNIQEDVALSFQKWKVSDE